MPSVWLLQSLSRPSHTSVLPGVCPTQSSLPLLHAVRPGLHTPMFNPHGLLTSTRFCGSSMLPSQLLSAPSHTSCCGTQPLQLRPSSTKPLQLSSMLLHTSCVAILPGVS